MISPINATATVLNVDANTVSRNNSLMKLRIRFPYVILAYHLSGNKQEISSHKVDKCTPFLTHT